jgi:Skp family chaperone for outer membrane proteins
MRAALGVLWLCTALLSAWPAFGQDAQDTGRSAPVLIVDMQRIKSDTSAGRDMLAKQTEIRNRIQAGLAERRERLREEENRLAEEREKLTPEAFREQVRAFEQQVFANREFSERESRRLQLVLSRASALLKERATAVLAGIMRERSAEVLLDSTQIILSVNSLDITDEAIRRLDEILPEIPIDLSKPEIEP